MVPTEVLDNYNDLSNIRNNNYLLIQYGFINIQKNYSNTCNLIKVCTTLFISYDGLKFLQIDTTTYYARACLTVSTNN